MDLPPLRDNRGVSQLDYLFGIIFFFTFLSSAVTIPQSPLYVGGYFANDLATDAHETTIHLTQTNLTDENGEISNQKVEQLLNANSMKPYIPSDEGINGNVTLTLIDNPAGDISDRGKPPSMFSSATETTGDPLPRKTISTSSDTIVVDERLVKVTVRVWR